MRERISTYLGGELWRGTRRGLLIAAALFASLLPLGVNANQYQALTSDLNDQNRRAAETSAAIGNTDAQLAVVQAQIAGTKAEIARTYAAIADAKARMAANQALLNELVRHEYQRNRESDLEMLVKAKNMSEFVERDEYLKAGQSKIAAAVDEVLKIKKALDARAADLGQLDAKLAEQQNGLAFARAQQSNSLAAINAAREQLKSKLAAYGGQVVMVGQWVNPGDLIGFMGTSGCSTGVHLHFEIQQGGSPANPANFAGRFRMPVSGYGVSQGFGPANWAAPYSFHAGIDMTSYFGAPVHAASGGTVVFAGYNRTGFGDHVIIDHGGGLRSIYGHLGARASDYPRC